MPTISEWLDRSRDEDNPGGAIGTSTSPGDLKLFVCLAFGLEFGVRGRTNNRGQNIPYGFQGVCVWLQFAFMCLG